MNAAIKNPSYNEIDATFKNLNISSKDKNKNESITSDELFLFKPKILQAIEYIREKRKRPDTNAIYEHLKKTEASNIDKETIDNIISELINQKILENKKSTYGDSFRLITGKEKDTLDEITSPDNIDKIDKKMITNLIQVSRLILNHLLTEMKMILLKKFHQLGNP